MTYENYRPPGSRLMPEVVKNLLIINVIMFVATLILRQQGIDLTDKLGLHYFASEKFGIWQFVTYMFMHDIGRPGDINIAHIGMNMLILYMFGTSVENIWGGKKFLTFYMITGFGAALTHYAVVYFQIQPGIEYFNEYILSPDISKMHALINSDTYGSYFGPEFRQMLQSDPAHALALSVDYVKQFRTELLNGPVVIGASGAIYGVLLAYGMLFPNNILLLFLVIPMKAKYAVILFGLMELYFGFTSGDNVAHFAHLGGLLTGIILILFWRNKNRRRRNDYFDQG